MRMRHDESGISELIILLLVILLIIVIIAVIAGGIVLTVAVFFGGKIGLGFFLFVTGGMTILAYRFLVKMPMVYWLAIAQFIGGFVFLVLGVLGR